jgi:hypothetical protein
MKIVSTDLNADLNLKIGTGREDTIKDNHLVSLRDVSPNDPQFKRFREHLLSIPLSVNYDCQLEKLFHYNKAIYDHYSINRNTVILHCGLFAGYLADAFITIDSNQNLRTTLVFSYFNIDRILSNFSSHELSSGHAEMLDKYSRYILQAYINIVYLDDLDHHLKTEN